MNRAVLFGIATLVAIIGLSLLGSEKQAVAGFGCHGGAGVSACNPGCGGGLFGGHHCGGRRGGGLFGGHHRCGGARGGLFGGHRNRCCGVPDTCAPACQPACNPCPPAPCGCAGGVPVGGGYPIDGGYPVDGGSPTPAPPAPDAPDAPDAPPAPAGGASEASFSTITFVK